MAEQQLIEDLAKYLDKSVSYRKRIIANKEREFWKISFKNEETYPYGDFLIKGRPNIFSIYSQFSYEEKSEYIRGLFDGDGSVVFYPYSKKHKDGTPYYRQTVGFSINGSQNGIKTILEDFAKERKLILSKYLDKRGNGSWYYSFNGKKSLEYLYHLFYDNDPIIKCERKFNVFQQFYNTRCKE